MKKHKGGWEHVLSEAKAFYERTEHPIPAFSEFMPATHIGMKPYGEEDIFTVDPGGNFGFRVSEYQERLELGPGLASIGERVLKEMRGLVLGGHTLSRMLLKDNPCWPPELAETAAKTGLPNERYSVILPLDLSRTLDDKGRVRWTLFGSSIRGPYTPFWKSFDAEPGAECAPEAGFSGIGAIFESLLGLPKGGLADMKKAGFRILPVGSKYTFGEWPEESIPSWANGIVMEDDAGLKGVRYLLTFRPFEGLPDKIKKAYLAGDIQLFPFPGSLTFFYHQGYRKLAARLRHATQIPFFQVYSGNQIAGSYGGIKIPLSGWLDEPRKKPSAETAKTVAETSKNAAIDDGSSIDHHGPVVSKIRRSSRFDRYRTDEEELYKAYFDLATDALFGLSPGKLGLYDKPMARNSQIWTSHYDLILDGTRERNMMVEEAGRAVRDGGHFGYRLIFPAMRAGPYEFYWHRPLIGCAPAGGKADVFTELAAGYITASRHHIHKIEETVVEFRPVIEDREIFREAIRLFSQEKTGRRFHTLFNIRKLFEFHELLGGGFAGNGDGFLPASFARSLLTIPKEQKLDEWLGSLSGAGSAGGVLAGRLTTMIDYGSDAGSAAPVTFGKTANREFEEKYWKHIAFLAEGKFRRKNNADSANPWADKSADRDLEPLGDYLLGQYRDLFRKLGGEKKLFAGSHYFRWKTEFDYPWSEGWARNQAGTKRERNLVIVLPGKNRSEAVIMADHYDTAYMEDVYAGTAAPETVKIPGDPRQGQDLKVREAAHGADDNYSATAALLLAAEALAPLSLAGKLERDIWLVHLTGEEFPSDCLGARNLAQRLVARNFAIDTEEFGRIDLSAATVTGAYIMDMIAHNNGKDLNVFQIAPGEGRQSAMLAQYAHQSVEKWNRGAEEWNRQPGRKGAPPYARSADPAKIPALAAHPRLMGEVRPKWHYASSHFNTDAQIFSEMGIPVVLIMEDYDINRKGYHDTRDTMENIDLDYGAALAAVAIESAAIAACIKQGA